MSYTNAIFDKNDPVSPLSIPTSQTAVLLLDYHTFNFDHISPAQGEKVIGSVRALKQWAHAHNALVVHGLVDAFGPMLPTFKSAKRIAAMVEQLKATPEAVAEHREIAPAEGADEASVMRTVGVHNALMSRGITELLKERGIKSLVIGGLSTSGCVAATARPAADEGFVVTVIEDACGDPKAEVQEVVLRNIFASAVHVCSVQEWVHEWEKSGGSK